MDQSLIPSSEFETVRKRVRDINKRNVKYALYKRVMESDLVDRIQFFDQLKKEADDSVEFYDKDIFFYDLNDPLGLISRRVIAAMINKINFEFRENADKAVEMFHKYFESSKIIRGYETISYSDKVSSKDAVVAYRLKGSDKYSIVLKIPNSSNYVMAIYHELIVGKLLNFFRAKGIPNFAYVYGILPYSERIDPLADRYSLFKDLEEVTITKGRGKNRTTNKFKIQVPILVTEYVSGRSVTDLIYQNVLSQIEVLNIIRQITYAIYMAQKTVGFVHYDLHTDNIIVSSKFSAPYVIKYSFDLDGTQTTRYVTTSRIATIIDYGFSLINVGTKSFGRSHMTSSAIYKNKIVELEDVFRFLLFLHQDILENYESLGEAKDPDYLPPELEMVKYIISFFTDDPEELFIILKRSDWHLPEDLYKGATMEDFIYFLEELYPPITESNYTPVVVFKGRAKVNSNNYDLPLTFNRNLMMFSFEESPVRRIEGEPEIGSREESEGESREESEGESREESEGESREESEGESREESEGESREESEGESREESEGESREESEGE